MAKANMNMKTPMVGSHGMRPSWSWKIAIDSAVPSPFLYRHIQR